MIGNGAAHTKWRNHADFGTSQEVDKPTSSTPGPFVTAIYGVTRTLAKLLKTLCQAVDLGSQAEFTL